MLAARTEKLSRKSLVQGKKRDLNGFLETSLLSDVCYLDVDCVVDKNEAKEERWDEGRDLEYWLLSRHCHHVDCVVYQIETQTVL